MKKRLLAFQAYWFLATYACFAPTLISAGGSTACSAPESASSYGNTGYYAFSAATDEDLIAEREFEESHPASKILITQTTLGTLGAVDIKKYLVIQTYETIEKLMIFQQLAGTNEYEQNELIVARIGSIVHSRSLDTEINIEYVGLDECPYSRKVLLVGGTEEDLKM